MSTKLEDCTACSCSFAERKMFGVAGQGHMGQPLEPLAGTMDRQ